MGKKSSSTAVVVKVLSGRALEINVVP